MIEAIFILHNILKLQGDDPTTIEGYNGQEDPGDDDGVPQDALVQRARRRQDHETEDILYRAGMHRRKRLLYWTGDRL